MTNVKPNASVISLARSSSSLSFKCAWRESGCRIGYEPTKNELRSLSAVDIQGHQRGGSCIRYENTKLSLQSSLLDLLDVITPHDPCACNHKEMSTSLIISDKLRALRDQKGLELNAVTIVEFCHRDD